jgi:hypothetical protein
MWLRAVERRWDIVPVVLQDPMWERTFPDVSGTMVPVVDPATGRLRYLRLRSAEAAERRRANEERWTRLLKRFGALDLDPVIVDSEDPAAVLVAFVAWSEQRIFSRGRR